MTNKLFTPLHLKNITLPGRAVRSATELFCSTEDAHVYPYEYEVYRELSCEPLGMIITAHTCVSPEGRSNRWQNAVWSEDYLAESYSGIQYIQYNTDTWSEFTSDAFDFGRHHNCRLYGHDSCSYHSYAVRP